LKGVKGWVPLSRQKKEKPGEECESIRQPELERQAHTEQLIEDPAEKEPRARLSRTPEQERPLLEVDSLSVHYTTERGTIEAVDEVSFTVHRGEAFGLAGESGSGKSTIAQTILRLLPTNAKITHGKITLEGEDILKLDEEVFRRRFRWKIISTVPQAAMNALTPVHRVARQITEAMITHQQVTTKEATSKALNLLEMVGIPKDRARDFPHQYSGGMRQRAVIAMALACNPSLLIADEPTTGLDVITQAEVLRLLEGSKSRFGLSLIFITHDLSILSGLCDRIAIMYAGQIVEQGDSDTILTRPDHPYTQALIASFPDISDGKDRIKTIPDPKATIRNSQAACRFYPGCESRLQRCFEEKPKLREVEEGHLSLCHQN